MNAYQTIKILKEMPTSKSIMLVAKHGVGKSSIVKQVAEDLGIEFYDVRLSQCEVGDIKGLPFLDEKNRRTDFLKPKWWPRNPDSKGILFFDELNRASKDVLQAVFEICLDRRLDGEPLPDGWRVVSAINATDDYDVVDLDPALLDRWFYIDFDPTPKEWIAWAVRSNINPSIVDYIEQNEELLDPPIGALEAGKVYPSRRSWAQLNDSLEKMDLFKSRNEGLLTHIVKGWVGTSISLTFPKFLANEFARLKPDDIIDNLTKEDIRKKVENAASDIESIAALSQSVCRTIAKRTAAALQESQKKNIREFMQMLPKDVASQFWVDLLDVSNMRKSVQAWKQDVKFSTFLKSVFINSSKKSEK